MGAAIKPALKKNIATERFEKAKKILDYKPQTSFNDGLQQVHHWFKEHWDLIEESAEFPNNRKEGLGNNLFEKTQKA